MLISSQRFDGSAADGNERDFHELPSTITTQFIRFKPVSTSICLRVEAYGTPGIHLFYTHSSVRVVELEILQLFVLN